MRCESQFLHENSLYRCMLEAKPKHTVHHNARPPPGTLQWTTKQATPPEAVAIWEKEQNTVEVSDDEAS